MVLTSHDARPSKTFNIQQRCYMGNKYHLMPWIKQKIHEHTQDDSFLDALDRAGVPWGMSNVLTHRGRTNHALRDWATQYDTYSIRSNYISHFDNTVKSGTHEIYVTNYHRSSDY